MMKDNEIKRVFSSLDVKSKYRLLKDLGREYETSGGGAVSVQGLKGKNSKSLPRPFLKWAGGKSRMVQHIVDLIPKDFKVYHEPFLGGGAVFFELSKKGLIKHAVLSDANRDLISCYEAVKNDVDGVLNELSKPEYFYGRPEFLKMRSLKPSDLSSVESAARFIYLNKTCFNGLFRVNSEGNFNVPFGKYSNPSIRDEALLKSVSQALKKADLICEDFTSSLRKVKKKDVVYMDPPYIPSSKTSSFTSYTSSGFTNDNHRILCDHFSRLAKYGSSVILSNSDTELARELYKDHELNVYEGARNIGGSSEYRGRAREILVSANCKIDRN